MQKAMGRAAAALTLARCAAHQCWATRLIERGHLPRQLVCPAVIPGNPAIDYNRLDVPGELAPLRALHVVHLADPDAVNPLAIPLRADGNAC